MCISLSLYIYIYIYTDAEAAAPKRATRKLCPNCAHITTQRLSAGAKQNWTTRWPARKPGCQAARGPNIQAAVQPGPSEQGSLFVGGTAPFFDDSAFLSGVVYPTERVPPLPYPAPHHPKPDPCRAVLTDNLRTQIMDFRGFDSSIILILRGGILMSIGNFPESLSQAILAGQILSREADHTLRRPSLPEDRGRGAQPARPRVVRLSALGQRSDGCRAHCFTAPLPPFKVQFPGLDPASHIEFAEADHQTQSCPRQARRLTATRNNLRSHASNALPLHCTQVKHCLTFPAENTFFLTPESGKPFNLFSKLAFRVPASVLDFAMLTPHSGPPQARVRATARPARRLRGLLLHLISTY